VDGKVPYVLTEAGDKIVGTFLRTPSATGLAQAQIGDFVYEVPTVAFEEVEDLSVGRPLLTKRKRRQNRRKAKRKKAAEAAGASGRKKIKKKACRPGELRVRPSPAGHASSTATKKRPQTKHDGAPPAKAVAVAPEVGDVTRKDRRLILFVVSVGQKNTANHRQYVSLCASYVCVCLALFFAL
jgi:hypothetical protein